VRDRARAGSKEIKRCESTSDSLLPGHREACSTRDVRLGPCRCEKVHEHGMLGGRDGLCRDEFARALHKLVEHRLHVEGKMDAKEVVHK